MHTICQKATLSTLMAILLAALVAVPVIAGGPAGTTISYQGLLRNGGSQVDVPTDLIFRIFNQETLGTQVGNTVTLNDTPVSNGLVSVDLDFGVNPYTSAQPLWLEVVVEGQPLSRQQVTSAPFSLATRGINVDAAENVGIGTTTPTARLDVVGDIKSSGIVSAKAGAVRLDKLASNSAGLYHSVAGQHVEFLGNNSTQVAATDFLTLAIGVDDRALLNSNEFKLLSGHNLWVDGGDVGIGTGTPAEKLDVVGNIHASGTVSADAFSSNSPLQLQTAGTTRVFVDDTSGNVGIGTSTPAARLHVGSGDLRLDADREIFFAVNGQIRSWDNNHRILFRRTENKLELREFGDLIFSPGATSGLETAKVVMKASGDVGIGTTTPAFKLEVNGTAGKPGGGSWSVSSDIRLKKNIQPLNGALDTLLALHGVTFEYKDPEAINELPGERIGFIAQEVEQVMPDWIDERADGYKALTIRGFEALTVEAMRDLSNENAQLRAELNDLRTELSELKAAMKSVARSR